MGIDAILVMSDVINYSPNGFSMIIDFGKKHNIPVGGGSDFMVNKGALFSYFTDNIKIGKLAATMADKET